MKTLSIISLFAVLFVGSMSAATPLELEVLQAYRTADFEKLQKLIDSGVDIGTMRDWSAIRSEIHFITEMQTDKQKERYINFYKLNKEKIRANLPDKGYYVKAVNLICAGKAKELKELLKSSQVKPSELKDIRSGENLLDVAVGLRVENDILEVLLEAGSEPNAPGIADLSPLARAAAKSEPDRSRILKCLIEHGGDMSFKPEGGLSAEEVLKSEIAREEKAKPAK